MYESFKRNIQPLINHYHLVKAIVANILYGFPSKKLKVIGVTGTDGKTTTTHLIYHILKSTGKKVSMISSISAPGLHTTTPDARDIQRLIKKAAKRGYEYFVLETTSHALDQNRVHGINFEVSVITNITLEHLDYHKTYTNYLTTKAKLLFQSKKAVINADDRSFKQLVSLLKSKNKKFLSYGLIHEADFAKDFKKIIPQITDYNNYNYLSAYSVATILGIEEKQMVGAIESFKLPAGRFEIVYDENFKVIIDFAHTPNSIESVLKAVRNLHLVDKGRLIHVFGSAGLRDSAKRSLMGRASGKYTDVAILTEEDYRTEDPLEICRQIARGFMKQDFRYIEEKNLNSKVRRAYAVILKRDRAIEKAVKMAKAGDVIIITGKSHEKSLARGKIEYPWDEKKAVTRALRK